MMNKKGLSIQFVILLILGLLVAGSTLTAQGRSFRDFGKSTDLNSCSTIGLAKCTTEEKCNAVGGSIIRTDLSKNCDDVCCLTNEDLDSTINDGDS